MTDRILLIEDDPRLAEMVKNYLGEAGFAVTVSARGMAGIALEARETFDALVLDLMLPDMDGLEVCRRIRARAADADPDADRARRRDGSRGRPGDRRRRLSAEAVRAARDCWRGCARSCGARPRATRSRRAALRAAGDRRRRAAWPGSTATRLRLTGYQFALLLALAQHAGRVMSRDAIMELMKNERLEAFDRSIDVHISRIRAAIEDDPKKPRRVITVRGAGYVFAKVQD